jgi:hypothetical protein
VTYQLTCVVCGETFTGHVHDQRYCGKTCSNRAFNERRKQDGRLEALRRRLVVQRRDWQRKKRNTDPRWRIDHRMSVGVWYALRDRKGGRSWESLVGYTLDELMAHLEARFRTIGHELAQYGAGLAERPQLVVLNKIDLV